ncbi:MAG: hypothetical protein AAFN10_15210 [Bacteroidota bacterium]
MINQRTKEKDDLKLVGRGHMPLGLGIFFFCLLSLFISLLIYSYYQEYQQLDLEDSMTLFAIFLLVILTILIVMIARGLLPLRWNAKNGLVYKPLRSGVMALLGGIFWSVFSIGCCIGFFYSEPVVDEELPRRLFFAGFGLISGYGGVYFLYQFLKRWQQFRRFGNSQLAIISGVPRRGTSIKVRLSEQELNQSPEKIKIRFANIQERFKKKKRKNQTVRVVRERLYEHREELSADQLTMEGIELVIPFANTLPTHYDRCQPSYWELELTKEDVEYQARFLISVTA